MDKIIYERDFDNEDKDQGVETREAKKIEFTLPGDLTIYEFYIVCIRIAKSLGYSDSVVKEVFDEEVISKDEEFVRNKIKKLLINHKT